MYPLLQLVSDRFPSDSGARGGPAGRPSNGASRKSTVLVVEDEVVIRLSVSEFLRDSNYRVLEAANADEARMLLQSREPVELVFSDIEMPGTMNGFELAKWIRENYPDLPVLLTSGIKQLAQTRGYGEEAGPVLQKPYDLDAALAHIKRLLQS